MAGLEEVVVPVAIALLGGGLITAMAQLVGTRAQLAKARQDDERLPAEVESIWLGGAEKAVTLLQSALDRAERQITQMDESLQRERTASLAKDERIQLLEGQLGQMRQQLAQMQTQCDRLGARIEELKEEES